MNAALAPAVLDELEFRLRQVNRHASATQLAERLMQIAVELRGHSRPPRDLALIAAATALVLAAECARRDTPVKAA